MKDTVSALDLSLDGVADSAPIRAIDALHGFVAYRRWRAKHRRREQAAMSRRPVELDDETAHRRYDERRREDSRKRPGHRERTGIVAAMRSDESRAVPEPASIRGRDAIPAMLASDQHRERPRLIGVHPAQAATELAGG